MELVYNFGNTQCTIHQSRILQLQIPYINLEFYSCKYHMTCCLLRVWFDLFSDI